MLVGQSDGLEIDSGIVGITGWKSSGVSPEVLRLIGYCCTSHAHEDSECTSDGAKTQVVQVMHDTDVGES